MTSYLAVLGFYKEEPLNPAQRVKKGVAMTSKTFLRRWKYECKACGAQADRLRADRKCERCGKPIWEALVEAQREAEAKTKKGGGR